MPYIPASKAAPEPRRRALVARSGTHLIIGLALWVVTPIAASFGTVLLGDRLRPIVFFGDETGSTTGDGPWELYKLLGIILFISWLLSIAISKALPDSSYQGSADGWGIIGGLVGFGWFCYQLYAATASPPSWILVPAGWLVGLMAGSMIGRFGNGTSRRGPKGNLLPNWSVDPIVSQSRLAETPPDIYALTNEVRQRAGRGDLHVTLERFFVLLQAQMVAYASAHHALHRYDMKEIWETIMTRPDFDDSMLFSSLTYFGPAGIAMNNALIGRIPEFCDALVEAGHDGHLDG